jgi:hypothetical protein
MSQSRRARRKLERKYKEYRKQLIQDAAKRAREQKEQGGE